MRCPNCNKRLRRIERINSLCTRCHQDLILSGRVEFDENLKNKGIFFEKRKGSE